MGEVMQVNVDEFRYLLNQKNRLIDDLRSQLDIAQNEVNFLRAENSSLKKKNQLLEASVSRDKIQSDKSYRDLKPYFGRIKKLALGVTLSLIGDSKQPVHYDRVIEQFHKRYPDVQAKNSTVLRRLQELVEQEAYETENGVFHIASPKDGYISVYVDKAEPSRERGGL